MNDWLQIRTVVKSIYTYKQISYALDLDMQIYYTYASNNTHHHICKTESVSSTFLIYDDN